MSHSEVRSQNCHPFAHTVAHAPRAYRLRDSGMTCDTILTLAFAM